MLIRNKDWLLGSLRLGLFCLLLLPCWAEVKVLVVFDSVDGHTQQLAQWISEAVQLEPDTVLRLKKASEASHDDLLWAEVILVGSPVYNAGLTKSVGSFLADWPFDGSPLKNKVGGAFVSAKGATAGAENSLFNILKTMMVFQMLPVGGEDWRSGFGVAYILDGSSPMTLEFTKNQAKGLGQRACRLARCTKEMRAPQSP